MKQMKRKKPSWKEYVREQNEQNTRAIVLCMQISGKEARRRYRAMCEEIDRARHDLLMEALKGPFKHNITVPTIKGEIGRLSGIEIVEPKPKTKRRTKTS